MKLLAGLAGAAGLAAVATAAMLTRRPSQNGFEHRRSGQDGHATWATRPRVVIVGAGFGGLATAKALRNAPVDLFVVDRNNYHTFYPLLYQVAAAELQPEGIAYPIRTILRGQENAQFVLGEVEAIDFDRRCVITDGPDVEFDILVIAAGSSTNFFGVRGAAEHAFPLRELDQGIALRNQFLSLFERAVVAPDPDTRCRLLTFVIVGGGPTGVEYAGALMELIRGPIAKDFPDLNPHDVRVVLVESQPHLFPALPGQLGAYAVKRLEQMGVDVRLGATVEEVTPTAVHLKGGDTIESSLVVWTAGVRGQPGAANWGLPLGRGGRIITDSTLRVPDRPNVFVIGDSSAPEGTNYPLVAPVAIQQAETTARNIERLLFGEPLLAFEYRDAGSMAVIGRNSAVAYLLNRIALTGYLAWIIWLTVHIVRLIGFRNRLMVLTDWAFDYFFFERTARLLLPSLHSPQPAAVAAQVR